MIPAVSAFVLTAGLVTEVTGGQLAAGDPGRVFTSVSIDSRSCPPVAASAHAAGTLFIALSGPNFDAQPSCPMSSRAEPPASGVRAADHRRHAAVSSSAIPWPRYSGWATNAAAGGNPSGCDNWKRGQDHDERGDRRSLAARLPRVWNRATSTTTSACRCHSWNFVTDTMSPLWKGMNLPAKSGRWWRWRSPTCVCGRTGPMRTLAISAASTQ